jgi:MFS family permease
LGWSSPVGPAIQEGTADGSDLVLTENDVSWVSSLLTVGALVGGLTGGALIDIFGRKTTLISINFLFAVGWMLIIAADGVGV